MTSMFSSRLSAVLLCQISYLHLFHYGHHAVRKRCVLVTRVPYRTVQEAVREYLRPQCAVLIGGPQVSNFYARQPPATGEAIDNTEWKGDLGYTLKNTARAQHP